MIEDSDGEYTSVVQGAAITATMSFGNLESDSDTATTGCST